VSKPLLVFDMDGVLVDVSESYRETIARTVQHFTGVKPTREQIQDYKNEGGHNDDWQLSHYAISQAGVDVPFEQVKEYFQSIFLGMDGDGLIQREEWIARAGLLERLAETYRLAIFTGRPRAEAELSLRRFAPEIVFDRLIAMEDVKEHKPAPEGLLAMKGAAFYIGDTVDDARCARAAKVPFIGIAGPSNPRYIDLVFLFQEEGSYAIIDDINYLEEVFAS
jgi:HAD superfamily hydrolase (TIGR01548 family)